MAHTSAKLKAMREGGRLLACIMQELAAMAKPGITTQALNDLAERRTRESGGVPAFFGYHGFTAGLCTSVNDGMVHGLPGSYILQSGDLLKLDYGVLYDGYFTDHAITVGIGTISSQARELLEITREALRIGLEEVYSGACTGDIGYAIEEYAHKQGVAVVKSLCGHGINKKLHDNPQIPNFGKAGSGTKLTTGMTIAIEPMLTLGSEKVRKGADGNVFETVDGSLAAHFEHTVVVTEQGCEILTQCTNSS
ncbi:MAG: type I methionyl aminopeptidase [Parcubacteria group bacterium RIFCSPHIGHO2_01_FULL_47_10b]|nr:MAG: type I methionyl aminopeptidase [Parcubacteria group bacterium RIFCSPHIGHO2_01_FULL_47_10b]